MQEATVLAYEELVLGAMGVPRALAARAALSLTAVVSTRS